MVNEKEVSSGLQWRVQVNDGSSKILLPESGLLHRACLRVWCLIVGLTLKVRRFFEKAWALGVEDPKKVFHCLKVGVALTLVSFFYYMRPLYQGVGGNAMWAVMTVVVVFEYTVGATLYKSLNRAMATFLAGALAVGIHWIASQSGKRFEPVIVGASVFLLASTATFSRFIPTIKARFDYGAQIFILTFSLVSVSGYRVDKLIDMAQHRLTTIAIGTSMCILISMLICPIWAGEELHLLITRNMDKLANSLDGCVAVCFEENSSPIDNEEESHKCLLGYKCVLNSKATEEAMANFARWEPAHGCFNFRHPWKQYLKIGTLLRNCAFCIEALNGYINSEIQAPDLIKKHLSSVCKMLSSHSSSVLKELAITTKTMRKSSKIDFLVGEMNNAVQELQNALKSLPNLLIPPQLPLPESPEEEKREPIPTTTIVPLMEVLPLVTLGSLLIEIAARIEVVIDAVEELAGLADFKPAIDEKIKQNQPTSQPTSDYQEEETMKVLQQV